MSWIACARGKSFGAGLTAQVSTLPSLLSATAAVRRSQANDSQFKQELAKVVGTELWDAAKAASADELKVRPALRPNMYSYAA